MAAEADASESRLGNFELNGLVRLALECSAVAVGASEAAVAHSCLVAVTALNAPLVDEEQLTVRHLLNHLEHIVEEAKLQSGIPGGACPTRFFLFVGVTSRVRRRGTGLCPIA
jgi:hypothetical protein